MPLQILLFRFDFNYFYYNQYSLLNILNAGFILTFQPHFQLRFVKRRQFHILI